MSKHKAGPDSVTPSILDAGPRRIEVTDSSRSQEILVQIKRGIGRLLVRKAGATEPVENAARKWLESEAIGHVEDPSARTHRGRHASDTTFVDELNITTANLPTVEELHPTLLGDKPEAAAAIRVGQMISDMAPARQAARENAARADPTDDHVLDPRASQEDARTQRSLGSEIKSRQLQAHEPLALDYDSAPTLLHKPGSLTVDKLMPPAEEAEPTLIDIRDAPTEEIPIPVVIPSPRLPADVGSHTPPAGIPR